MKIITYAVIQSGQCVFGTGSTEAEAYQDACNWLDKNDEVDDYTPEIVEQECDNFQFDGDLRLIDSDDEEFDRYMTNQGGFTKTVCGWIDDANLDTKGETK